MDPKRVLNSKTNAVFSYLGWSFTIPKERKLFNRVRISLVSCNMTTSIFNLISNQRIMAVLRYS